MEAKMNKKVEHAFWGGGITWMVQMALLAIFHETGTISQGDSQAVAGFLIYAVLPVGMVIGFIAFIVVPGIQLCWESFVDRLVKRATRPNVET